MGLKGAALGWDNRQQLQPPSNPYVQPNITNSRGTSPIPESESKPIFSNKTKTWILCTAIINVCSELEDCRVKGAIFAIAVKIYFSHRSEGICIKWNIYCCSQSLMKKQNGFGTPPLSKVLTRPFEAPKICPLGKVQTSAGSLQSSREPWVPLALKPFISPQAV